MRKPDIHCYGGPTLMWREREAAAYHEDWMHQDEAFDLYSKVERELLKGSCLFVFLSFIFIFLGVTSS